MLALTSSGIAQLTDNLEWLAQCLNALFHPDYRGDTKEETLGMLRSAREKRLGSRVRKPYEPREQGPIPLGFTKDGLYALRDQTRNIIVTASAQQLLSLQYLLGLGGSGFWAEQFPHSKGLFDSLGAGEALITACRRKGAFNPLTVRGRGIWREGERIIINLGDPVPADVKYLYLCFDPIRLDQGSDFDAGRLLRFLQLFRWRNPQDAMLLLGWLAIAPVCGVLAWRPHCFAYGPPKCGKTTIHSVASALLRPLVISTDGQSSEAGIRQALGPDSLPVIIDEFESDQSGAGLRGVLRLARSASSADTPVLRGTPEGKAMQFSLHTSFFFCAVNPSNMSQADQTRILLLELQMHDSDPEVGRRVAEEARYFRSLGSAWCGLMISLAHQIAPALDVFERVLPSTDTRHRQNMATLLGAAFVALHRRVPSEEEATTMIAEFSSTIELHAEEAQRDDARECLDFLLSYVVNDFPLGHWLAIELRNVSQVQRNKTDDAHRIVRTFDIVVRPDGAQPGFLIRNGSPAISRIFEGTRWSGHAWQRSLRKLDGCFFPENPVNFGGLKSRCLGLPLSFVPEPFDVRDMSWKI